MQKQIGVALAAVVLLVLVLVLALAGRGRRGARGTRRRERQTSGASCTAYTGSGNVSSCTDSSGSPYCAGTPCACPSDAGSGCSCLCDGAGNCTPVCTGTATSKDCAWCADNRPANSACGSGSTSSASACTGTPGASPLPLGCAGDTPCTTSSGFAGARGGPGGVREGLGGPGPAPFYPGARGPYLYTAVTDMYGPQHGQMAVAARHPGAHGPEGFCGVAPHQVYAAYGARVGKTCVACGKGPLSGGRACGPLGCIHAATGPGTADAAALYYAHGPSCRCGSCRGGSRPEGMAGGCQPQNTSLRPEQAALAERDAWMRANSSGAYAYTPEAGAQQDSDMMQYHSSCGRLDYATMVQDLALGAETRMNHARWVNEVHPWSAGRARKVDTLEEENYVDWVGIRGPHNAVEVANPSQITELDPADLARWGNRTVWGKTGSCYRWQG